MGGRIEGKAAAVTGAASGMGRAIARRFAAEGASVAVLDCDREGAEETTKMIAEEGGKAILVPTDVTEESSVEAAVGATVKEFGGLDIFINNAGIVIMANVADTTVEDWDRVHNVNLRGTFLCCKYAVPQMIDQGGGAIVNIASISSFVSIPMHAAYSASKAGLLGLTRDIAVSHGRDNIRANCVCPTSTDTPLIRKAGAGRGALKRMAKMHPLRRITEPEDIANACLFLASDEARCITGIALPVDAGWTAQ
ncbi:MAG: SDR family oxidoreductase [Chloroflexi bacterium]|nr:SDR family oxidoreductase [Chloroflexota bacterium]